MIDANAATGGTELPHIGPGDDHDTANAGYWKDFLRHQDLSLPSTFDIHCGSSSTWFLLMDNRTNRTVALTM